MNRSESATLKQSLKIFGQAETPDSLILHLLRLVLHLQLRLALASSLLIAHQLKSQYSSLKQDVHVDVAAELEPNANSERYHHHYHRLRIPHTISANTRDGSRNDVRSNQTSGFVIVIRDAFSETPFHHFLTRRLVLPSNDQSRYPP